MTDLTQLPPRPLVASPTPPPASGARGGEANEPVKVKIDTPGVTIEIEANGSLDSVTKKALKLFRDAGGWPQPTPSAVGFQAERRGTYDTHAPINTGGAT